MRKTSSSLPDSYAGLSGSFIINTSSSGRAGCHPVTLNWLGSVPQIEDVWIDTKTRDPTNQDVMTAILAAIHYLQTQTIGLAEKQVSTTSTVSFLADETNKIMVGVAKL